MAETKLFQNLHPIYPGHIGRKRGTGESRAQYRSGTARERRYLRKIYRGRFSVVTVRDGVPSRTWFDRPGFKQWLREQAFMARPLPPYEP